MSEEDWAVALMVFRARRSKRGAKGNFMGDKAYDADALREEIVKRGGWANNPAKSNHRDPAQFSVFLYRNRNLIERFFNLLKYFRAIALRYEKRAENYLALIKLAAVRIWLRTYESMTGLGRLATAWRGITSNEQLVDR